MSDRGKITDSQFYMWRTLFALSHADNEVVDDEIRMMSEVLEDIPFTEEQAKILKDDIHNSQDPVEMFEKISNSRDQAAFFDFARRMVWADGAYDKKEQDIMLQLQRIHMKNVNFDDLIGNVNMSFETDYDIPARSQPGQEKSISDLVERFKLYFLSGR